MQNTKNANLIKQFTEMTDCTPGQGEQYLKTAKWDFNVAIDLFFEDQSKKQVFTATTVAKEYLKFAKNEESPIEVEGIQLLLEALKIEMSDSVIGYLFYLMNAKCSSEITKNEFTLLFQKLNVNSINDLKNKVPTLKSDMNNKNNFRSIYMYLFDLYKQTPKNMSFELATGLWELYLEGRFYFYKQFLTFLSHPSCQKKPVSKDTWRMVLQFEYSVSNDLNNYRETDGWPVFLDRFVEYLRSL